MSSSPKTILVLVPQLGFDPSEAGIPFKVLTEKYPQDSVRFVFAAPESTTKAKCDPIMIDGVGLYFLKWSMHADNNGQAAYKLLQDSKLLEPPHLISWESALEQLSGFDALLLPGGHCQDVKPYLESKIVQKIAQEFDQQKKPICAVCHGTIVGARAGIFKGKSVTALESWQEGLAYNLTRLWMGNYYRTYADKTTESEVRESGGIKEFVQGPKSLSRDSMDSLDSGHVVQDGNILTARWPGDCHKMSVVFGKMIFPDNK
jgi:protease I